MISPKSIWSNLSSLMFKGCGERFRCWPGADNNGHFLGQPRSIERPAHRADLVRPRHEDREAVIAGGEPITENRSPLRFENVAADLADRRLDISSDLVHAQHAWPAELGRSDVRNIVRRSIVAQKLRKLRSLHPVPPLLTAVTKVTERDRQIESARAQSSSAAWREAEKAAAGGAHRHIGQLSGERSSMEIHERQATISLFGKSLHGNAAARAVPREQKLAHHRIHADAVQTHMAKKSKIARKQLVIHRSTTRGGMRRRDAILATQPHFLYVAGGRMVIDELLQALTHSVRLLTVSQIAWLQNGPNSSESAASARVRRLQASGVVNCRTAMIQLVRPEAPLLNWTPERVEPDLSAVAYRNQLRWRSPAVRTAFVTATRLAGDLTGGPLPARRDLRPSDLSHDAALAWVFLLHYRGRNSVEWLHEDALAGQHESYGGKRPDAVVHSSAGPTAIELTGRRYSARRLAAIHRAYRHSSYVLW